jgi:MFS family permease
MDASDPRAARAASPRPGWALGLTSTAYFMVVLDSVVVITALPRMQRDLHAGLASLQWTLTAYNIAFAAGIITAAAAGDRFGRRRVFNAGLGLFTVASAACALAPGVSALIAARTVQGLAGAALVTGSAVAVVWALVRAGQSGRASAEVVSCLACDAVLLLAFVAWERRAVAPMVPPRLFRSRAFAAGNAATFLMTGAIFAAGFLVTQEFQLARGYSPVAAGVRLLPFFATPMLVSPAAGALSDRAGRRPVMVTGLFMQAAGFAWVAVRGSLATSWVELDIALLVAGVGVSMALPTVPAAVLNAVAPGELGKASGVNFMMQRFGAVFAIAAASAVFSAYGHLGAPAGVTGGFRPALGACAGFALLAAFSALAVTPARAPAVPAAEPVEARPR